MLNPRSYGARPYTVAVVHGGPGAGGEMAPVARELARTRGVLEPIQTALSLQGQIDELRDLLRQHADLPVALIGYSWGAWLSYLVAAYHPMLVRKLVLVSSGPFEQRYVGALSETRLARLSQDERTEWRQTIARLQDPSTSDKDAALGRLGALASKTDAYDPLPRGSLNSDRIGAQGDIFHNVWQAAAQIREDGTLLALAHQIRCPVVAIHGDYDPHPARGVEEPLSAHLEDFAFLLLKQCGHTPWLERQARDQFYQALEQAL
jgi:pimeloyl-ACP methyl ester carboxylesterase